MALLQKYKFVDDTNPLDCQVGVPYVKLESELNSSSPFAIVPVEMIQQRVQAIEDFRPEQRANNNYWINWWITFGKGSYPHQYRWKQMRQFKWRNLHVQ